MELLFGLSPDFGKQFLENINQNTSSFNNLSKQLNKALNDSCLELFNKSSNNLNSNTKYYWLIRGWEEKRF